jgi:hypothetical protein
MPGSTSRPRDLRLDLFRGVALLFIFIDHIPDNLLTYFTLHSVAFCDAAEVFIFISGYAAALVYGRALQRHGALLASVQIYRRVWQLYVTHIVILVLFVAEVSYAVGAVDNPMYTEELRVGAFLDHPHIAIIEALLLRFQPTYLDILPLYIVLLAAFPLILLGLRHRGRWLLAASALLYLATLWRHWSVPAYPPDETWYFNPLAWQFLFVIGAACGLAADRGRPWLPPWPWLYRLATLLSVAAALISLSWGGHDLSAMVPALWHTALWPMMENKSDLAPLRLVNFFAVALMTVHLLPADAALFRWRLLRPILLCGQNALYVFCAGILLSVGGHFVLAEFSDGLAGQLLVNVVGIALMLATAVLLTWYKAALARAAVVAS